MVIQATMSPHAIAEVWGNTAELFKKHNILLSKLTLEELTEGEQLTLLLEELNSAVGSSDATCIVGG
ncbi:hypothetical protein AM500_17320 [Bacillus sp. FJAT-18017]|uniref:hypothetical protein n=1 Tax=Bacillus sp. FJAT-18017 TaxID=1705566 RepID=UPI0006AE0019|nr:hypothetical protein [Bacillus sp. FJAT-18017]ALC91361.1 hypothetical protein AM500_17320 [Bacillus sp. FJAT-18017]